MVCQVANLDGVEITESDVSTSPSLILQNSRRKCYTLPSPVLFLDRILSALVILAVCRTYAAYEQRKSFNSLIESHRSSAIRAPDSTSIPQRSETQHACAI